MKVLWFTNTPSLAPLKGHSFLGGWISSLEFEIRSVEYIKLGLAFSHNSDYRNHHGKTNYYGIKSNSNSKIKRLLKRYIGSLQDNVPTEKILSVIDEFQPDIIHIHGTESDFIRVVGLTNVPVVVSIQGVLTVYKSMYFKDFEKKHIARAQRITDYLLRRDTFAHYKAFGKMAIRENRWLKQAQYVIGRTKWDEVVTRILAPKAMYFKGNEILRPEFYDFEWSPRKSSDEFSIVSVLGPNVYKGIRTIYLAASLLEEAGFDFEWKIIGIDTNSLSFRAAEKTVLLDNPLKNLKLLGRKNAPEIVACMLNADVYVSASYIENSPNNVCEAMLLGMPIIASSAGGTSTLIKDEKDGFLFQPGDAWGLSGLILKLFHNPDLGVSLARQARQTAKARHDRATVVKEYLEIYSEIIKGESQIQK